MATRTVVKTTTKKDVEKNPSTISKSEQMALNKDWESKSGIKLGKGENVNISEQSYAAWKKGGNYATYYNEKPKPEPTNIGKLQTKKLTSSYKQAEIIKAKKPKVEKVEDKKFVPKPGTKKLTKGGGSVLGSNIKTSVGNVVNKAKFEIQKKQAKAGERALRTEGYAGGSSRERLATLKDVKSNLKEVKKAKTGVDVKGALKDVRKGIKYEKKVIKGKNVYSR